MKHPHPVQRKVPFSGIAARLGPGLLRLVDVADYLAVSPSSVKRLVERRQLPFIRVGRLLRFRRDDIVRLEARLLTDTLETLLIEEPRHHAGSPSS